MLRFDAAKAYLGTTLPRDMKVAATLIASKKLQTCAILFGLLVLTLLVSLLAMGIVTGHLPSIARNTDYWGLAYQRLTAATAQELPGTLLETMKIYLDYPAIWFIFERISFEEQARTLAMDTTTVFPVINIRYLIDNAPIALLLAVYLVLSRHRTKGIPPVPTRGVSPALSISIPGSSSAMTSLLAPMACCGGTAVQSAAYVVGFVATAPLLTLFSRLATIGVAVLIIIGIAWTARKINSPSHCASPQAAIAIPD